MRFLLLFLFLTGCASTSYEFERGKYDSGQVCPELVGVWYSDMTVRTKSDGRVRYITQVSRDADGTGYLKGIGFYQAGSEVQVWEFPMTWRCDYDWYTEKNEWGYTAFKIQSISDSIIYVDELKNLGVEPYAIIEVDDYHPPNEKIREFFDL